MTIMDVPEYVTNDFGDEPIIAGKAPANWQRLAQEFSRIIHSMRMGHMALSLENESHGIVGPQVDGCLRVDIELVAVYVFPHAPSNSRRTRR